MIATPRKKRLHDDFIQEVQEKADIVQIIGDYVELKQAGKDFLGCCPFHKESTPSFTVTPEKGLAYCFGCNWGGNSLKFLRWINSTSFTDAILEMAHIANIPVRYEEGASKHRTPASSPPRPVKPPTPTPAAKKEQAPANEDAPNPSFPPPVKPPTPVPAAKKEQPPAKDYTVDRCRVDRSTERLLSGTGDAAKALTWLKERGITCEMAERYQLGLEKRVITPDPNNPDCKEEYPSIAIFIPVPERPGRFYVKKRVAPWLTGDQRPEYLANWAQFGLKSTIWFSHNPADAEETWLTEGEWDAILLAELARQREAKVAVACSTSGAGTLPPPEQLERLPGNIRIFYDRDEAGAKGARKLAKALNDRATIGTVPMPDNCQVKGWDVTNAILTGYGWEDFEDADVVEAEEKTDTTPPNESGIISIS